MSAGPEMGIAHDTGLLVWGMWVCDCEECRQIMLMHPDTTMVIKGSGSRIAVLAGKLAQRPAEDFLPMGDYVREVFVAEKQVTP